MKLVAVSSPKGGVGKTTISVALAFGLRRRGYSVGLADIDFHGPTLPVIVTRSLKLPKVEVNGKYIVPVEIDGVKIFSLAFVFDPEDMIAWSGSQARRALRSALDGVDWGYIDVLIADLPPGLWDPVVGVIERAFKVIVVTEPTMESVFDAMKLVTALKDKVGAVVLNNSRNLEPEVTPSRIRELTGWRGPIVEIPFSPELHKSPKTVQLKEFEELINIVEGWI